jgi:MFS family permease
LAPVEQAILVDTFPPAKRAAAFALYSTAIVTAPAIGPPLVALNPAEVLAQAALDGIPKR